jgi:hypothetical protein
MPGRRHRRAFDGHRQTTMATMAMTASTAIASEPSAAPCTTPKRSIERCSVIAGHPRMCALACQSDHIGQIGNALCFTADSFGGRGRFSSRKRSERVGNSVFVLVDRAPELPGSLADCSFTGVVIAVGDPLMHCPLYVSLRLGNQRAPIELATNLNP